MEGCVLLAIFGAGSGFVAGMVCAGFWRAFCLITARAVPTSDQISGCGIGGACTGVVAVLGLLGFVIATEGL